MQVGLPEVIIILLIVVLLFGSERVLRSMRELGHGVRTFRKELRGDDGIPEKPSQSTDSSQGSEKPDLVETELPADQETVLPPGGDNIGRDQNTAIVYGSVSGGTFIVGSQNVINYFQEHPQITRCFQQLFPVFVSYTENQQSEREAIRKTALLLGIAGLGLADKVIDEPASPCRSKEQVEEGLRRGHIFLMAIPPAIDPAQLEEHRRAKALGAASAYFYLAKTEQRQTASQVLEVPSEAIAGYVSADEIPGLLIGLMTEWLVDSALHRKNPYQLSHADLSLLLGLAEVLRPDFSWLAQLRDWIARPTLTQSTEHAPSKGKSSLSKRAPAPNFQPFEPELIHVPAGSFWMGSRDSDLDAYKNEKPRHLVELDEYWIGRYPVTVEAFAVFIEKTGWPTKAEKDKSDFTWCTPRGKGSSIWDKARHPVTCVSWSDAAEYCRWLSRMTGRQYSLPTEAQWEKAARGLDERAYPWGDSPPDHNRCNIGNWFGDTTPVGKFSPFGDGPAFDNPHGCADLAGNVWEWCVDGYEEMYDSISPRRNPVGRNDVGHRVLRGGSWNLNERFARCAYRFWSYPDYRNSNVGFRVVVLPSSTLHSDPLDL